MGGAGPHNLRPATEGLIARNVPGAVRSSQVGLYAVYEWVDGWKGVFRSGSRAEVIPVLFMSREVAP